jgi:hypothetical protein
MLSTIVTKYLKCAGRSGARFSAKADTGWKQVFPFDFALSETENHAAAAALLRKQLGWTGDTTSAQLPDGRFVHVTERPY